MALAPRRDLFGVPSSSIIMWSIWIWFSASMPPMASKISPLTASTAFFDALAEIALAAIAQFDGFMRAGGSARGNGGAAQAAIFEKDIDFDSRVATAIENFAADDIDNCSHGAFPFQLALCS